MFSHVDGESIFRVRCSDADEAYLMLGSDAGVNQTIRMNAAEQGLWEARVALPPGTYRYRFYTKIKGAMVYQPPREDLAFWIDGWDARCLVPDVPTTAAASAFDAASGPIHRATGRQPTPRQDSVSHPPPATDPPWATPAVAL